ncbi:eCIS core domain-containing protein [Sporocytophaga myxococcoides]|uniref:eCIS core domain-containing protein n=1 Tax=Sporocytophaga myxococcoides TaxID=153721 RepID=UPI000422C85C|nr:DUF4157 domain-containing protein [Sporocytophaga myxococcoides]
MGEFLHGSCKASDRQNLHQSRQTQLKPLENKSESNTEEEFSNKSPETIFQRKWDSFGGDDENRNQPRGPVPLMAEGQESEAPIQRRGPLPLINTEEEEPMQRKGPVPIINTAEEETVQRYGPVPLQFHAEEVEEPVQRRGPVPSMDLDTDELSQRPTSSSDKMPLPVQRKMESSFGEDFSDVNIHTNSSQSIDLNAHAFAKGSDIHFAPGMFNPESQKGQELLGHELTHVLQQREGRVQPTVQKKGVNINDDEGLEKEADEMGEKAAKGYLVGSAGSSTEDNSISGTIQKSEDDDPINEKIKSYNEEITEASLLYGIPEGQIQLLIAQCSKGEKDFADGQSFGLLGLTETLWNETKVKFPELANYEFGSSWNDARANILLGVAAYKLQISSTQANTSEKLTSAENTSLAVNSIDMQTNNSDANVSTPAQDIINEQAPNPEQTSIAPADSSKIIVGVIENLPIGSKEEIIRIQSALKALGYYSGIEDGIITRKDKTESSTIKAIRNYQKDNHLAESGNVDVSTNSLLIAAVSALPTPSVETPVVHKPKAPTKPKKVESEKIPQSTKTTTKTVPAPTQTSEQIYAKHGGEMLAIGKELLPYAKSHPDAIIKMLDYLTWSGDNLAYNISSHLSEADLSGVSKDLIKRLYDEMDSGYTSDLEQLQMQKLNKFLAVNIETLLDSKLPTNPKDIESYFVQYEKMAKTELDFWYSNSNKGVPEAARVKPELFAKEARRIYAEKHDLKYVVPVQFALAQLKAEGGLVGRQRTGGNVFNVGAKDSGITEYEKSISTMEKGFKAYYSIMADKYLAGKGANNLLKTDAFKNQSGGVYATNPFYEMEIKSEIGMMHYRTSRYALSGRVGNGGDNKAKDVAIVGSFLNKAGYLKKEDINGVDEVTAAIKNFQQKEMSPKDEKWFKERLSHVEDPVDRANMTTKSKSFADGSVWPNGQTIGLLYYMTVLNGKIPGGMIVPPSEQKPLNIKSSLGPPIIDKASLDINQFVEKIFKAIDGIGTDEEAIYVALASMNYNQGKIDELKKAYFEKYKVSLIEDLKGDLSGHDLKTALELLNAGESNINLKSNPLKASNILSNKVKFSGNADEASIKDNIRNILGCLAQAAGLENVIVTGTARTALKQAQVMYDCLTVGDDMKYKAPGERVQKVYYNLKKQGKGKQEIIDAMHQKVIEEGPENVSAHCADYSKKVTVDLGYSSNPMTADQEKKFIAKVKELMKKGIILDIQWKANNKKEQAYHIVIDVNKSKEI